MNPRLRSLYICYLSLEDPLVHTQVVAYLAGLAARGHTIHLLTYDPELSMARRRELRAGLAAKGIHWHSLRYHKRPSLPATVYDALRGVLTAVRLVRRHRLDALHARNHVPAVTALLARRLTGCRLIFDLRGLMAEEYADAGHWKRGGVPFRITEWIQRRAIEACDAMVMLTERVRQDLFGPEPPDWTHAIPCCANLERIERQMGERRAVRGELGFEKRSVLVYVGKFTGRYREREMVEFFASARRRRVDLALLVLTQSDRGVIVGELERAGIAGSEYVVTQAPPDEVGRFLAAADFAICFYGHARSEIAASPTKIGEYLGAGLPIVCSSGVGDTDALLRERRVGVSVAEFAEPDYDHAAAEVLELVGDRAAADRCREAAHAHLSLEEVGRPRYDAVYSQVAGLS